MSDPYLTPSFCTDEDIAARFRSDFVILCGPEYMAQGADGAFSAGDRWTVSSASNAFAAQGVARGNVVHLRAPAATFGATGLLFAVESASGQSATLRRVNMAPGLGVPPGPAAGLSSVTFAVPTLQAQAELASYDIEKRYGISRFITGRQQSSMFDIREVRDATILTLAYKRYQDLARQAEKGQDLYYAKSATVKQELADLLDRVTVHWAGVPEPMRETNRFNTRIVR